MRNIVTTYCSFSLLGTTDWRIKKIEGGLSGPYEARTPAAWTQGHRARAQHPCPELRVGGGVMLCCVRTTAALSHSHSQHCSTLRQSSSQSFDFLVFVESNLECLSLNPVSHTGATPSSKVTGTHMSWPWCPALVLLSTWGQGRSITRGSMAEYVCPK